MILLLLQTGLVLGEEVIPECGTKVYPTKVKVKPPIINSNQVWTFKSAPNLHPMKVKVSPYQGSLLESGLIFNAPYTGSGERTVGQTGSLMTDNNGNPIWFRPLKSPSLMNTDFRIQKLNGKKVITFWQGTVATPPAYTNLPSGAAEKGACYYILNHHYQVIRTIKAFKGFTPDVHELLITPNNTALFFATKVVPMDLRPYGGPAKGAIHDFSIQEVDLATNQLIYFWDAKNHIPLTSSHMPASTARQSDNVWDPYHLNSLGLIPGVENDLLFSGRNTWTIYRLHKPSRKFVWQLSGDGKGDFKIPDPNARFSWQHDARFLPGNIITMFDDSCCKSSTVPPGTPPSHGLILNLDLVNKIASFDKSYFHNTNIFASSQGNTQTLSNGSRFVGFGAGGYYTEFAEPGNTEATRTMNILYNAKMPGTNVSYRSYRHKWVGKPLYPPSVTIKSHGTSKTIYVSWNGATEVKKWIVLAGRTYKRLIPIKKMNKKSFETAITVNNLWHFFQVIAVDKDGKIIGRSRIIFSL